MTSTRARGPAKFPTLSIRLRLAVWYSAVLLLGLVLFSAAIWLTLQRQLLAGVDARLTQRLDSLGTTLRLEAAEGDDPREELHEFAAATGAGWIEIRGAGGEFLLPPNRMLMVGDLSFAAPTTVLREGRRIRIHAARVESYEAAVAIPLDEVEAVLGDLRRLLLWLIPLDFAAACAGGYWISRRALAPVDAMTRAAASISAQHLGSRLNVPQTGDELQLLAEAFNEVLSRLEASLSRVRQFTADASHELRTPVSLIQATAELALRRPRTEQEYRESLQQIEEEARRMGALTESLLTLARADAEQLEMPLSATDVTRVVTEVVHSSAAIGESRNVRVTADLGPQPAVTTANEVGIRRLLLILVDNALKHTPAGGVITVSALPVSGGVALEVRDTGVGIPSDALPHIFERFFSADASHGGPSAGLGLSIAQAIAAAHGAQIAVDSAPGQGSRFSLLLKN
jgi:heavy metal sensor kinase